VENPEAVNEPQESAGAGVASGGGFEVPAQHEALDADLTDSAGRTSFIPDPTPPPPWQQSVYGQPPAAPLEPIMPPVPAQPAIYGQPATVVEAPSVEPAVGAAGYVQPTPPAPRVVSSTPTPAPVVYGHPTVYGQAPQAPSSTVYGQPPVYGTPAAAQPVAAPEPAPPVSAAPSSVYGTPAAADAPAPAVYGAPPAVHGTPAAPLSSAPTSAPSGYGSPSDWARPGPTGSGPSAYGASTPPVYSAPPAPVPPGYGQPPAYGQPTAYGQPPAYGQPNAYGQPQPGYPQYGAAGPYPPAPPGYQPPGYPTGYPQPGQPPYGTPPGYPGAPAYGSPPPFNPNAPYSYYFPQPKPPRRGRTALIVSTVVVALLLCAGAVIGVYEMGDPTHSPTAGGTTGTASTPAVHVDTTTLNGVLYEQSVALLNNDVKGFLATVDPNATAAVAAYQRIFHNMRQMHVTIWEQDAPSGNYVTDEPQSYEVDVTYCLVVKNCQETDATWHVTAALKSGRAMIESFTAPTGSRYTSEPYPWEVATLTALTGPRVVVAASSAESGLLQRALRIAEHAATAADQYAHWGKPAVYVLYLANPAEGRKWFDGDLQNADGVTYTIQPHDLEVVALLPDADDPGYAGPGVLNAVVQHEFGHVATLIGDETDRGHDSFIEGIAEYCAYNGHTNWAAYRLQDVRAYIKTGKWQHSIYLTSEITSKSVLTSSAAYGIGYLGLRYIAATYGVSKMLDFWGYIERDGQTPAQASTKAFGKPWSTVNAAAATYVQHAVGL
jgi:hypothetical protein